MAEARSSEPTNPAYLPGTVYRAIQGFLDQKADNRAPSTVRTYTTNMRRLQSTLEAHGILPHSPADELTEDIIPWLMDDARDLAPSSEALYRSVISEFYRYLDAERYRQVNLSRVAQLLKSRGRKNSAHIPQFPKKELEQLIEYAERLVDRPADKPRERLRDLRDRALILTLADTGLRIHEALALTRGSIDRDTRQAVIVGKGDQQDVVRFSRRAMAAIQDYLRERQALDGGTGKKLASLPLFARHDMGAGKRVEALTTKSGQDVLATHVRLCLGLEYVGLITPHTLRHRFVTRVLNETRNLVTAQRLARHRNIAITQRYAHLLDSELDEAYEDVFD